MKNVAPKSGELVTFEQVVFGASIVSDGNGLLEPPTDVIIVINSEIVGEHGSGRWSGCGL